MTITKPAVHEWDDENVPLVDVEPVEPAQPSPKPKKTRKPKQPVDVASATAPATEISLPANGTIRLVVDNGNVTVIPESGLAGPRRLGGVTRELGLIKTATSAVLPATTNQAAAAATAPTTHHNSKADEKPVCLELRLTYRAAFLACFSLVWTLVLAKALGAL